MARYRLKRKTFAFLGIGNMWKNLSTAGKAFAGKGGTLSEGLAAGARGLGTGALYVGTGLGAYNAVKGASDIMTGEIGEDN